jgi:hypothetical protein
MAATLKNTPGATNEYSTIQFYSMKNKNGETLSNVRALNDQDALYTSGVSGEFSVANNAKSVKVDTAEKVIK